MLNLIGDGKSYSLVLQTGAGGPSYSARFNTRLGYSRVRTWTGNFQKPQKSQPQKKSTAKKIDLESQFLTLQTSIPETRTCHRLDTWSVSLRSPIAGLTACWVAPPSGAPPLQRVSSSSGGGPPSRRRPSAATGHPIRAQEDGTPLPPPLPGGCGRVVERKSGAV